MAEEESNPPASKKEQVVDPWTVSAAEGEDKIDYDKLISKDDLSSLRGNLKCTRMCFCLYHRTIRQPKNYSRRSRENRKVI